MQYIFLENKLDHINWKNLSLKPNALHILEKNLDKVNWVNLYKNPNIFDYDYEKMKLNTSIFKEELIAKAFHPSRIIKWLELKLDPTEM